MSENTQNQSHVLSVLVQNDHGVLSRISGLFAARGFNIDSLTVGETHDPRISRMTLAVHGDAMIIDQIEKQLNKVLEVITVKNLTSDVNSFIDRELILVKVEADKENRSEVLEIVNVFDAKTVDITTETVTIQITGNQDKLKTFMGMLDPYGILEVARTGRVGMLRGSIGLHAEALSEVS